MVRGLGADDAELLAEIASTDDDAQVRRLAVDKLHDADALARIAASERDPALRAHALARATERFTVQAMAGQDVEGALVWLGGLDEQRPLAQLACRAATFSLRERALERLRDQRALAEVVRDSRDPQIAATALARIVDRAILRKLAMDIESRDLGAAVMDRIDDDTELLAALAARAKSKAIRQRANKRLAALRAAAGGGLLPAETPPAEDGDDMIAEAEAQLDTFEPTPLPEAMPELFSEPIAVSTDPPPHPDPDPDPGPGPDPDPDPGAEPVSAAPEPARPKKPARDPALPEKNLAALEAVCADMERVVADAHVKLKTAEKKLQQADSKLPSLAVLPSGHKRKAMERFQEARRQLFIKVGELREAEEWKRWANVPKQEELIAAVEALAAQADAGPLPVRLKQLQDAWKAVGPAPKEKAQDLWQRFKSASDKVYERVVQHRHEVAGEHKDNLKKKQELCVRAEELAESTDWGPAAEALKRLQAEWKAVGPVPRKQADEVWKRFRAACDRFFERRRPHLEKTLGERQANLEAKQSLVERAEALAGQPDEADWESATRQVGFLRREWREVGPVPQRDFEVLSRRFFDACDRVYARRDEAKQNLLARRLSEVTEPFAAAEALVASAGEGQEIDGAALAENVIKARAALREFEAGGASLGDEVRERMAGLCRRAVEIAPAGFKGTDLDPEQSRKRKERLLARVADLASKAAAAPAAPTTPQEMAARLKAALADRALGGVLAKETRPIREQVAEAREAWRKLGPVPGPDGEELERRFEDACQRATGTG
ncbi:MAG TPA: DUF349 domain-containing protein [Kofleriaceae bacterium]|nr:DUF349 domain-containing protein [Kofleriaceae bacterium]